MKKYVGFLLIALIFAGAAQAEVSRTVAFSRAHISILRNTPPTPPPTLPWLIKPGDPDVVKVDPAIGFEVDVRDAQALYKQQGWFNLSEMTEGSGTLMVFAAPSQMPINRSTQFAPMDIVLADGEGKIVQIIPNIKLSELEQDIIPSQPVLAFLFLKGGTCASQSINPGDKIEYSIFRKAAPVVVMVPVK